jgi:hypothetical protein
LKKIQQIVDHPRCKNGRVSLSPTLKNIIIDGLKKFGPSRTAKIDRVQRSLRRTCSGSGIVRIGPSVPIIRTSARAIGGHVQHWAVMQPGEGHTLSLYPLAAAACQFSTRTRKGSVERPVQVDGQQIPKFLFSMADLTQALLIRVSLCEF